MRKTIVSLHAIVGLKPSLHGRIEARNNASLGDTLDGVACFIHVNLPSLGQRLGINVVFLLGIEGPACCS